MKKKRPSEKKPRRPRRKLLVLAPALLLIAGGLAFYLWSFLNGEALRKTIIGKLRNELHRDATVDSVELNLWRGTMTARGVRIFNRPAPAGTSGSTETESIVRDDVYGTVAKTGKSSAAATKRALAVARRETVLRIGEIRGKVKPWPLVWSRGREIRAARVTISAPELTIERAADPQTGRLLTNVDDLWERFFGGPPGAWPKVLGLDALEAEVVVEGGRIVLLDRSVRRPTGKERGEDLERETGLAGITLKVRQPGLERPLSFKAAAEVFLRDRQTAKNEQPGRLELDGSVRLLSTDAVLDPTRIGDGAGTLKLTGLPPEAVRRIFYRPEKKMRLGGCLLRPSGTVSGVWRFSFADLSRLHFAGSLLGRRPAEVAVPVSLLKTTGAAKAVGQDDGRLFSAWTPLPAARLDAELTLVARSNGSWQPAAWRFEVRCGKEEAVRTAAFSLDKKAGGGPPQPASPAPSSSSPPPAPPSAGVILALQTTGGVGAGGLKKDAALYVEEAERAEQTDGLHGTARLAVRLGELASSSLGRLLKLRGRLSGAFLAAAEVSCADGTPAAPFGKRWRGKGSAEFRDASLVLTGANGATRLRQPLELKAAAAASLRLADDGSFPPAGGVRLRLAGRSFRLESTEPLRWVLPALQGKVKEAAGGAVEFRLDGRGFWREWGPLLTFMGVKLAPVEEEITGKFTLRRGMKTTTGTTAGAGTAEVTGTAGTAAAARAAGAVGAVGKVEPAGSSGPKKEWTAALYLAARPEWDRTLPVLQLRMEANAAPRFTANLGKVLTRLFSGEKTAALAVPAAADNAPRGTARFSLQLDAASAGEAGTGGEKTGGKEKATASRPNAVPLALKLEGLLRADAKEVLLKTSCPRAGGELAALERRLRPYRRYLSPRGRLWSARGRWNFTGGATLRRLKKDDAAVFEGGFHLQGEGAAFLRTAATGVPRLYWEEPHFRAAWRGRYSWHGASFTHGVLELPVPPPAPGTAAAGESEEKPAALVLDCRALKLRLNVSRLNFARAAKPVTPADPVAWLGDFYIHNELRPELPAFLGFLHDSRVLPRAADEAAAAVLAEWVPGALRLEARQNKGRFTLSRLVWTASEAGDRLAFPLAELDLSVSETDLGRLLNSKATQTMSPAGAAEAAGVAWPERIVMRRLALDPRPFTSSAAARTMLRRPARLLAEWSAAALKGWGLVGAVRGTGLWRAVGVTMLFDRKKREWTASGLFDTPLAFTLRDGGTLRCDGPWSLEQLHLHLPAAGDAHKAGGAAGAVWNAAVRLNLEKTAWKIGNLLPGLDKAAGEPCLAAGELSFARPTGEGTGRDGKRAGWTLQVPRLTVAGGPLPLRVEKAVCSLRPTGEGADGKFAEITVGRLSLAGGPLPMLLRGVEYRGPFVGDAAGFRRGFQLLRCRQARLDLPRAAAWSRKLSPATRKRLGLGSFVEKLAGRGSGGSGGLVWEAPLALQKFSLSRTAGNSSGAAGAAGAAGAEKETSWTVSAGLVSLAVAGRENDKGTGRERRGDGVAWRVRGRFSLPPATLTAPAAGGRYRAVLKAQTDGLELFVADSLSPLGTYRKGAGEAGEVGVAGTLRADGAARCERLRLTGGSFSVTAANLAVSGAADERGGRPGFLRAKELRVTGGPLPFEAAGLDYVGPLRTLAAEGAGPRAWAAFRRLRLDKLSFDPRLLPAALARGALRRVPESLTRMLRRPGLRLGAGWGVSGLEAVSAGRPGAWRVGGTLRLNFSTAFCAARGDFRITGGNLTLPVAGNDRREAVLTCTLDARDAALHLIGGPTKAATGTAGATTGTAEPTLQFAKKVGAPASLRLNLNYAPPRGKEKTGAWRGETKLAADGAELVCREDLRPFLPYPYTKKPGLPLRATVSFSRDASELAVKRMILRVEKTTATVAGLLLRNQDRFAEAGFLSLDSLKVDTPLFDLSAFTLDKVRCEAAGKGRLGRLRFRFRAPEINLKLLRRFHVLPPLLTDRLSGLVKDCRISYDGPLSELRTDPIAALRRLDCELTMPRTELFFIGARNGETVRLTLTGRFRGKNGRLEARKLNFDLIRRFPPLSRPEAVCLARGHLDGLSLSVQAPRTSAGPAAPPAPARLLVRVPLRLTAPLDADALSRAWESVKSRLPKTPAQAPDAKAAGESRVSFEVSLDAPRLLVGGTEFTDVEARGLSFAAGRLSVASLKARAFAGSLTVRNLNYTPMRETAARERKGPREEAAFSAEVTAKNVDLAALRHFVDEAAYRAAVERARRAGRKPSGRKRQKSRKKTKIAGRLGVEGTVAGRLVSRRARPRRRPRGTGRGERLAPAAGPVGPARLILSAGRLTFSVNDLEVAVPKKKSSVGENITRVFAGVFGELGGPLNDIVHFKGIALGLEAYASLMGFSGRRLNFAPFKVPTTIKNGLVHIEETRLLGRKEIDGLVLVVDGSVDQARNRFGKQGLKVTPLSLPAVSRAALRLDEWQPAKREAFLRELAAGGFQATITGPFDEPSTAIPTDKLVRLMDEGLRKPPAKQQQPPGSDKAGGTAPGGGATGTSGNQTL